MFGVGIAGFIFVPTARVYGKRHAFLIGTMLLIASNIWAGAATSYRSILWARILQGVGVCPFEALLGAVVGDLYHVHVRVSARHLIDMRLTGCIATWCSYGLGESCFVRWCILFAGYCRCYLGEIGVEMDVLLCRHLLRRHASLGRSSSICSKV